MSRKKIKEDKKIETYKLKQSSNLCLSKYFPKITESSNILIIGNTYGFFGYSDNNILDNINDENRERLFWLLNAINKKSKFLIICNKEIKDYYELLFNNIKNIFSNINFIKNHINFYIVNYENECLKKIEKIKNMKFDICIQNPPFSGQLHLKFLKKVSEISKTVVSIQPSDWVQKGKNPELINRIKDIEFIDGETFRNIFNIQSNGGGIFILDENGGYDTSNLRQKFPIDKIKSNIKTTFKDVNNKIYNEKGIFVPLKLMTAEWDKNKNYIVDKIGILINSKTLDGIYYKEKRNKNKDRKCGGIYFNTLKEAENFVKYTETDFFVKLVNYLHISSRYLLKDYPFLDDYTHEWTDIMLYNYFKLTPDEIQQIKDYKI